MSSPMKPLELRRHSASRTPTLMSPDTSEFVNLEAKLRKDDQFHSELELKLEERRRSVSSMSEDTESALQKMEQRQMRQFSRADEYLFAMKEDLAEWLNLLYPSLDIDTDNFFDRLETGENLIQHANSLRAKFLELMEQIQEGQTRQRPPDFRVPDRDLPCRFDVTPGTWFARDNVFNFIKFCRVLGVMECIMFETEDLVCRKNEKHVILTLLEVARRGAKIGMLAPMLVQFEQEIDQEIAREERERRREEREEERQRQRAAEKDMFTSMMVEVSDDDIGGLGDVEGDDEAEEDEDDHDQVEEEEEEEEEEGYAFPIGPLPQTITNDLKSLDELVRELVSECQCPSQFPMIRVSDGKYRIGDTKVLIFVRILRNHVMVRVGGGWDTLQHYLDKHDPCRCRAGHRSSTTAHLALKNGVGAKNSLVGAVCYDRHELIFAFRKSSEPVRVIVEEDLGGCRSSSPSIATSRRRSSTSNLSAMGSRRTSTASLATTAVDSPSAGHRLRSQSPALAATTTKTLLQRVGSANTPPASSASSLKSSDRMNSSPSLGRFNANTNHATTTTTASAHMSDRSDSSSSIVLSHQTNGSSGCDSSSEVSDEGYKSSRDGSKSNLKGTSHKELAIKLEGQSIAEHSDRPSSSLTEASECSSTISSSDGEHQSDVSEGVLSSSPEPPMNPVKQSMTSKLVSRLKIPNFRSRSCDKTQGSAPTSPTKTRDLSNASWRPISARSLSMCSDQGDDDTANHAMGFGFRRNVAERHSYRSPSTTSRYMQAAEAYTARSRAAIRKTPTSGTWSGRGGGDRPAIRKDTFLPISGSEVRPSSRAASASPAPSRRIRRTSASDNDIRKHGNQSREVLSTKSTPSKKPLGSRHGEVPVSAADDIEGEHEALKKLEEILLSYKSKVEDHLAAEGRQLPKEIFDDFTTQWVNEASNLSTMIHKSSSRSCSRQRRRSGSPSASSTTSGSSRLTPSWRKEHREGHRETRIPVPTFYNSPSEAHI